MANVTDEAREGYEAHDGALCPYLYSSTAGMAWRVGEWLRQTGRSAPRDCRTSRGYTLRINDMVVRWNDDDTITRIR